MRTLFGLLFAAVVLVLSGCGYNAIQTEDEQVKASWSEVLNQYQRRADLVPNLVNTVKGYANQEKEVLTKVTEARAQVGSIRATPELLSDPQAFAEFESAQGQLTSSLSRLLVVSENYPQLKSDANFRDLQAQLEGTENRIAVARTRYIRAVQQYNSTVRSFPNNLTAKVFGYQEKPNFSVANEAEISRPPRVDFGATPASAGGGTIDIRSHTVRVARCGVCLRRDRCTCRSTHPVADRPRDGRDGNADERAAFCTRANPQGLRGAKGNPDFGSHRPHHAA